MAGQSVRRESRTGQEFFSGAQGRAGAGRGRGPESAQHFPRRALAEFYAEAPWIVGGSEDGAKQQVDAIAAMDPVQGHLARARGTGPRPLQI